MTARIIDGKAIAAGATRTRCRGGRPRRARARPHAGPCRGPGRQRSRQRSLCPQQAHRRPRLPAWTRSSTSCRPTSAQADLLALIGKAQRAMRPCTASSCNCRCRNRSTPKPSSTRSIPPRMSTACIRTMPGGSPAASPALSPCTPLGCIILTKSVHASLEGMNAIVIGRSNLVGRPLVQLLLNENATVTIAHSRSRDLAETLRPRRSGLCEP